MERTILLAEDSPTQAQRVQLLLESEGYRVDVVGNGREGLESVESSPPDLVISDVVMPEMDGYAFCRAIKSNARLRRIPFVLLTELGAPADVLKGLQDGADNFITKPFEDDYLLERVRRIFANLELRRQGALDVEITISAGGRQIVINTDKQQMIELLFATLEEIVRMNGRLVESQRDLERKVEERSRQLLQTEKLATMGQLLAGVAHELNNPLSVVMGRATLLWQRLEPGPLQEQAAKLERAAQRCARIVKNFLALARQQPPERRSFSLNDTVREATELLAYPLRVDNVELVLDLATNLPALWGDPHQCHQVLVNLITNAHHAMRAEPGARQLTITTRLDATRPWVHLEVADTGPGVPAEIRDRIFEPFFTTKPLGIGTGLGLSLCRGIVEEHGGSIGLKTEPRRGAVFHVEIPVTPPVFAEGEVRVAEGAPRVQGKAILVVDDEPEIGSLLAELLSSDGHQVDVAESGIEALEKLKGRTYDLVVSDLRMPGLDGPGLYREMERRHPELLRQIVFITGDALGPEMRGFLERVEAPFLRKPFVFEEVHRVVQQVLQTARGDTR